MYLIFRYLYLSIFQEPIFLDKCVICWEQDWEDYFEIQEFVAKEAFIFKVSTIFISSFTFNVILTLAFW